MTIKKNSDYGRAAALPPGSPITSSDAELRNIVCAARSEHRSPVTVGLLAGDLCRTLGGSGDAARLFGPQALTVPVDLPIALIDGTEYPFVAHLLVGRPFANDFAVVMNAQWLGELDLGPRSHPGDGLIDVTTGTLPWTQRRLARRRAHSGSHLPHPSLKHHRTPNERFVFSSPVSVQIDSGLRLKAVEIEIRVEPDAFFVVV